MRARVIWKDPDLRNCDNSPKSLKRGGPSQAGVLVLPLKISKDSCGTSSAVSNDLCCDRRAVVGSCKARLAVR